MPIFKPLNLLTETGPKNHWKIYPKFFAEGCLYICLKNMDEGILQKRQHLYLAI